MNSIPVELQQPTFKPTRLPFYYGWVNVAIAALAMVGTLPGRTQGLGLITEPLLKDLQLDRVAFAQINLWATLLGALFCIGIGRLVDRLGSRVILTLVALLLGTVVLAMSSTAGLAWLALFITLTRGLGQSALSVISITIVGKWFVRRINLAMAVYTILLSIGFMVAFPLVGSLIRSEGWRMAWGEIGVAILFILVPASVLLVRRSPESIGLQIDGQSRLIQSAETHDEADEFSLFQALSTPAFWVFALSSSVYGLIASGIALFNESILAERGFDATIYYRTLVITALAALVGNFLGGWLASRWSPKRLMALAMGLLATSLLALPQVNAQWHVVLYAVVMGLAGGFVMVIFFSFWSLTFGRGHLGKIQGAAQTLTVLASAIGPLLLAQCVNATGSYATIFYLLAGIVGMLGIAAWVVPLPAQTH